MPLKQLRDLLENQKVKYSSILHSPAFTAQEVAASAHISGKALAKTVIVKADGQLAMVVLPANSHIDFAELKKALHAEKVDLASESEFKDKFAGCEVGAMPPFGNMYEMPVYLSSELKQQDQILFNAGSHSELMQMSVRDFERLVRPQILMGI